MESRSKACFKVTNVNTGKVTYTRDRDIIASIRAFNNDWREHYKLEFISNTPPAIEVLYLDDTKSSTCSENDEKS